MASLFARDGTRRRRNVSEHVAARRQQAVGRPGRICSTRRVHVLNISAPLSSLTPGQICLGWAPLAFAHRPSSMDQIGSHSPARWMSVSWTVHGRLRRLSTHLWARLSPFLPRSPDGFWRINRISLRGRGTQQKAAWRASLLINPCPLPLPVPALLSAIALCSRHGPSRPPPHPPEPDASPPKARLCPRRHPRRRLTPLSLQRLARLQNSSSGEDPTAWRTTPFVPQKLPACTAYSLQVFRPAVHPPLGPPPRTRPRRRLSRHLQRRPPCLQRLFTGPDHR